MTPAPQQEVSVETIVRDRRQSVAQIVAPYEPTESTTMLLLSSCMADYGDCRLVIASVGEITDEDWATVMETFPIHNPDYDYDFSIHDGYNVIVITDWDRPSACRRP
jgi:hypothetical protein